MSFTICLPYYLSDRLDITRTPFPPSKPPFSVCPVSVRKEGLEVSMKRGIPRRGMILLAALWFNTEDVNN